MSTPLSSCTAWLRAAGLGLLLAGLAACSTPEVRVKPQAAADPVDMAGNWELDYARSDNLQASFNSMLRQIRDQAQRNNANGERNRPSSSVGTSSQETLLAMAQMAELITESQLLDVEQSRVAIRVKREGNFALSCDYGPDAPVSSDYGVGSERCYWDGRQLIFQIRLPDGLDIVHRLSVSESAQTLGIQTSLFSSRVATPFTVRRIYRRYVPGSSGYKCSETLTRGRVCTTESS